MNESHGKAYKTSFFLLTSFILGNGLSYLVFGLGTASKQDVANGFAGLSAQIEVLKTRQANLENQLDSLKSYLHGKRIIGNDAENHNE